MAKLTVITWYIDYTVSHNRQYDADYIGKLLEAIYSDRKPP